MAKYAANTDVSIDRSRAEIEHILHRYKATAFMYGWQEGKAAISFDIRGRRYRIVLPLPSQNDPEFKRTPVQGKMRSTTQALDAWEQACRQRWRAFALWIKAVLEAEESGITTLEQALVWSSVLPNGATLGQWLQPQLEESQRTGNMPPLITGLLGDGKESA